MMGIVLCTEKGVCSDDEQVEGNEDDTNPLAEAKDPVDGEETEEFDDCDEEYGHIFSNNIHPMILVDPEDLSCGDRKRV